MSKQKVPCICGEPMELEFDKELDRLVYKCPECAAVKIMEKE